MHMTNEHNSFFTEKANGSGEGGGGPETAVIVRVHMPSESTLPSDELTTSSEEALAEPERNKALEAINENEKEKEELKSDKASDRWLKNQLNISCGLFIFSGAAIFGGLHDRIGNENSLFIHNYLFQASSYSLFTMFFSSGSHMLVSFRRRSNKYLNWLANAAICVALGAVFFATAFAFSLLLDLNMVGTILVLAASSLALALVVFMVYWNEPPNSPAAPTLNGIMISF